MSVDSGTRSRLIWGFISQWVSKLSYTAIQLIQVPFFLHFWSENVYGEWLIINALPNYLLFSNLGFATVAGNEMSMSVAKGDRDAALRVFQSCWWLITLTMTITGLAVITALKFLPLARILNVHDISESDAKWCIAYLGITILLGQLEGMMQSAYRGRPQSLRLISAQRDDDPGLCRDHGSGLARVRAANHSQSVRICHNRGHYRDGRHDSPGCAVDPLRVAARQLR